MAKQLIVSKENDKYIWSAYSNGDIFIVPKGTKKSKGLNYGSPVVDACLRADNIFCGINANSVMYVFQFDETAFKINASAKCFPFELNNPKSIEFVNDQFIIKTPDFIFTTDMYLKKISKVKI